MNLAEISVDLNTSFIKQFCPPIFMFNLFTNHHKRDACVSCGAINIQLRWSWELDARLIVQIKKDLSQLCKRSFGVKFCNLVLFVGYNSAPNIIGSPNALASCLELNNLAVIYKQIHFWSIIFNVPFEYLRISCFKHHIF